MHLLHSFKLDSSSRLSKHFMPHQIQWIQAEKAIHKQRKQAVALAEKSVRIGWTYADAFKNVRKRLRFRKRDYLFATKDLPSALEYMRLVKEFAALSRFTRAILNHGEEYVKVSRLDPDGKPTAAAIRASVLSLWADFEPVRPWGGPPPDNCYRLRRPAAHARLEPTRACFAPKRDALCGPRAPGADPRPPAARRPGGPAAAA